MLDVIELGRFYVEEHPPAPQSRLSCQAILAQTDLTVEIPKYSINHAKEIH